MNLGEFKERTKDLPDDTEIFIEEEAMEYAESCIKYILHPALNHSNAVLLSWGQIINFEYDLDARIDAALEFGDAEGR